MIELKLFHSVKRNMRCKCRKIFDVMNLFRLFSCVIDTAIICHSDSNKNEWWKNALQEPKNISNHSLVINKGSKRISTNTTILEYENENTCNRWALFLFLSFMQSHARNWLKYIQGPFQLTPNSIELIDPILIEW